jgi:hypothetical protein
MTNTKTVAINAFVCMVPIMAILYSGAILSSGLQDNENGNQSKKIVECDNNNSIHAKTKLKSLIFDMQPNIYGIIL